MNTNRKNVLALFNVREAVTRAVREGVDMSELEDEISEGILIATPDKKQPIVIIEDSDET